MTPRLRAVQKALNATLGYGDDPQDFLDRLKEAGYWLAPIEPTPEMVRAFGGGPINESYLRLAYKTARQAFEQDTD